MKLSRKWLFLLLVIFLIVFISGNQLAAFYIDLLWFTQYGFVAVLWTILGTQVGLAAATAALFFLVTYSALKFAYIKTAHLPVVLSEAVRRDVPFLQVMADHLKPLVLFIPLAMGIMTGLAMAQQWDVVLKYLYQSPFGQSDPIFGMDYSFYLFTLPFLGLVKSLLWQMLVLVTLGVALIHFFKQYITLTAHGIVTYPEARRAFSWLSLFAFLLLGFNFYLQRYGLLVDGRSSVVTGIGFADAWGRLPALNVLTVLSLGGAIISFLNQSRPNMKPIIFSALTLGAVFLAGNGYAALLKKFIVDPNELIKETPFIEHTIAGTKLGYGLDKVEENTLTGGASLTTKNIQENRVTLDNIRLWDQGPLLETLGQIQEIRTYYQFQSVDNDRYTINGHYQQTLLSPRELLSSNLPNRTWINEHLTFTHGYGVSLSPVSRVTPEGLPVLHIKDIPPQSKVDLKVTRPEIYFGELSNDHVFVNTGTKEFDYPEGEKNVYKNYQGSGGVLVGSFPRKVLMAIRSKTLKVLFSEDIGNESRLLLYRNIRERVRRIAPFLSYDRDPYLVINDAGRLVWIYDAYTTSNRFPYSQQIRDQEVVGGLANYMRNSVKITIDAYEGNMAFYVADPEDPIIRTYRTMFPDLFSDMADMPPDLRRHIRYPQDLFTIQTMIYTVYHMKNPQVFYNKEDQWEVPVIDERTMHPYFTIMKLPGKEKEEYILMLPFTPQGKQNLAAWMVARSDGENYGKIVVYNFPKQSLIYGPSQIVARINQDAEISRQISLWDQRGSKVIQGNLLVIPIEESLIYVRPLYIRADSGKIPELKRVIVGYEDQIAMERTLEQALDRIFTGFRKEHHKETAASPPPETTPAPAAGQGVQPSRMVLSRSDYQKVRDYYDRAVNSQGLLDRAMEVYRQDLKGLGQALDSAQPLAPQPAPPATPASP